MLRLLGLAVLLLAAGGVTARVGAGGRPSPPPGAATSSTPGRDAPPAAPGDVVVEVTEARLTEQVNAHVAGRPLGETPLGPATLRQLGLQLRDGRILADGDAQVGAATVPVSLAATAEARAGRPAVTVESARAAGVPLPEGARQRLERALQEQVDELLAGQRLRVSSLSIAGGKLVLTGSRS